MMSEAIIFWMVRWGPGFRGGHAGYGSDADDIAAIYKRSGSAELL